ncbi:Transcription factor PCL1 [Porphyridium purpureum]|uniref:Transcription factor PCL1 n=1 Tax=Porphyridium purpureum TaxID=35688 RepID=A0A5J4YVT4_PORPP|nr:Transcription factor PCL1 [Porphyridium purpureum]|eukprot:POR2194..scf227_4
MSSDDAVRHPATQRPSVYQRKGLSQRERGQHSEFAAATADADPPSASEWQSSSAQQPVAGRQAAGRGREGDDGDGGSNSRRPAETGELDARRQEGGEDDDVVHTKRQRVETAEQAEYAQEHQLPQRLEPSLMPSTAEAQTEDGLDFLVSDENPLPVDPWVHDDPFYSRNDFYDTQYVQLATDSTAAAMPYGAPDDGLYNEYAIDLAPALPDMIPEDHAEGYDASRHDTSPAAVQETTTAEAVSVVAGEASATTVPGHARNPTTHHTDEDTGEYHARAESSADISIWGPTYPSGELGVADSDGGQQARRVYGTNSEGSSLQGRAGVKSRVKELLNVPRQPRARLEPRPVLDRTSTVWKREVTKANNQSISTGVAVGTGHSNQAGTSSRAGTDDGTDSDMRTRLVWTPELHDRFVQAVRVLGLGNAMPRTILQVMNVDGLTTEHIKSHLQKYRQSLKKQTASAKEEAASQSRSMKMVMRAVFDPELPSGSAEPFSPETAPGTLLEDQSIAGGPARMTSSGKPPAKAEVAPAASESAQAHTHDRTAGGSAQGASFGGSESARGRLSIKEQIERQLEMQERTMQLQLEMQMIAHRTVSLQRKLQFTLERQSEVLQACERNPGASEVVKEHSRLLAEQRQMQEDLRRQQVLLKSEMEEQERLRRELLHETRRPQVIACTFVSSPSFIGASVSSPKVIWCRSTGSFSYKLQDGMSVRMNASFSVASCQTASANCLH